MTLSKIVQMNAALEAIFGPVAAEDSLEGLNDECVRNHTESREGWEHFPLEHFSQFKALRLLLRSVSN